jgi:hypothetical protein
LRATSRKNGLHRAPLQRVMKGASRRASFNTLPVVVIADRREHMMSPEPNFFLPPYLFGHTRGFVRLRSAAARASRRAVTDGIAPAPVGAADDQGLRFRRRNQHLGRRLSHDRQIREHREKEDVS